MSGHYEDKISRKREMYTKVIFIHNLDVDAVFAVGVNNNTMYDIKMAKEILDRTANSGLF